jgi:N-methylhydantoinase B
VVTGTSDAPQADLGATSALRERLRADRPPAPFFDRGPGYARLSGGDAHNALDWL